MAGRCKLAFRGNSQWEKVDPLCPHVLGTLPITKGGGPPKQMDGDNDRVDHALDQEQEVGVVGRRVLERQRQQI